MPDISQRGPGLVNIGGTTVPFNANAATTLFIVPSGKRFVPAFAFLVVGANPSTTNLSIGSSGTPTDFIPVQTLTNLAAANDAAQLRPVPSATPLKSLSYAGGTSIVANVTNQAGGASNTIWLFGFLY